jgi:hypothetical protein
MQGQGNYSKFRNRLLIKKFLFSVFYLSAIFLISCKDHSSKFPVHITVDNVEVGMGRTVNVEAVLKNNNPEDRMILLPFVNGRRWGSHEFANKDGKAGFIIPLPNPGPALIQVIAVPADTSNWQGLKSGNKLLKAGAYMPDSVTGSNTVLVQVKHRKIIRKTSGNTLFGVQWESWFLPDFSWETAQGVPIMGFYDNTDADVYRQQILWFMDMGVDFIIPDWSNHMWGKKHWTERTVRADGILHTTQLFLEVLADMRDEGLDVPKVALMPGLTNGPPTTMEGLNEQLEWIYQDYVRNPRFKGLWMIYDGKPLIIILDTGILGNKKGTTESAFRIPFFKWSLTRGDLFTEASIDALRQKQGPVDTTHFTVRWMSSQDQTTRHHELGYWSWMDGSLKPMVTYKDGKAESVTVTPSLFAEYGWTAPEAYGRRSGWTYLESFKTAIETRPRVIMLHQWNEYKGQKTGKGHGPNKDVFLDTYSVEFSDDLEPISPTAPGYRGVDPYGFYYLNLTRALMDIYRGDADDVTLLAVNVADSTGNDLKLEWTTIGVPPKSFTVQLDGKTFLKETTELACSISKAQLKPGVHAVSVEANGAGTRYELSKFQYDMVSDKPMPVVVEKTFRISK